MVLHIIMGKIYSMFMYCMEVYNEITKKLSEPRARVFIKTSEFANNDFIAIELGLGCVRVCVCGREKKRGQQKIEC